MKKSRRAARSSEPSRSRTAALAAQRKNPSRPAPSQLPNASFRRRAPARRVVVTAGPTREYVDPVRFLSNESSGRMGFAIARAAAEAGCAVTLVTGPVSLPAPAGVERVDVISAREMLAATRAAFRRADALFMSAAVADWRPRRRLGGKWRRKDEGGETATLELVRNPDVLATLARQKGERLVVGFALETGDGRRRAARKLSAKDLDYVVLNAASALNAARASVTILGRDGSVRRLQGRSKEAIAKVLLELPHPVERNRRKTRGSRGRAGAARRQRPASDRGR